MILGTEANDTFVVTKDGVFGAGLNIAYTNIQAIMIDGRKAATRSTFSQRQKMSSPR